MRAGLNRRVAGVDKSTCLISTGTYTGDGGTSQAITGIGFSPLYVRIWHRETANNVEMEIHEATDTIVDDNASGLSMMIAENSGNALIVTRTDRIISLDADGFTVDDDGTDSHPNKNTQVYNYLCLGVTP